jgi:integrase
VILSRNGRRITMRQVQRRLGEWLAKADVQGRFSPHGLRHTFATELYRRTRDVALVQAGAGACPHHLDDGLRPVRPAGRARGDRGGLTPVLSRPS